MSTPPFPYRLRPMEGKDLPAVMALDRESFSDPWPESAYTYELYFNPTAYYFVLEPVAVPPAERPRWRWPWQAESARPPLLGFVGIRFEGGQGHISVIAVAPAWRGRGLGELLLLMVLERSLEERVKAVTLEVRVSNQRAQNLYFKYGFVVTSRLQGYYQDGEDAYLMRAGPLDGVYRERLQQFRQALERRLLGIDG